MSVDVGALKAATDLVSVVGAYVSLKKRGGEYIGLCPFHDDSTPSFYVIPNKNFCNCFACGWSGDVIDFIQEIEKTDFKGACEKLGAQDIWTPRAPIEHERRAPLPDRKTSKPPPNEAEPHFALRTLGEPQLIFPIHDLDGSILGYECRYAGENGKKEIRIWSWGARGDAEPEWGCGHFNAPRPLYGLPRLAERPDAPVSIFEGPKKAEAGKRLLPAYACISWTGGANAWHKHDWSALKGRNIILWPDADEPGRAACEKLAALLSDPDGLACSVRTINTEGQPEGWDIADAEDDGWDTLTLVAWAKPRAVDYQRAIPIPAPQGEAGAEIPPPSSTAASSPAGAGTPPPDDLPPVEAYEGDGMGEESLPASMSEDMLADRFARQHGARWRYVKPWNAWFEWLRDGWYKDDTRKIDRLAVEITRQALYWPEAKDLSHAVRCKVNSKHMAGAVRDLATSDRRIAATTNQWDTDKMLLGVPGGVVDLKTGKMRDARPDDYITKRTAIAPAEGDAPIWRQFLETVTAEDGELIAFLQRFGGYALTGETIEQCLAFLYGTGQNGKGVFITTLSRILGDYAIAADADVFMESDHQRHPTEMARLRGARLVYVDETDGSKRWNEKRIKRVTGGGKLEARFMHQDDFEFEPHFKIMVAGNHKPQLRGVGKAIKRRMHLVPFTVTIPDSERDDRLSEKLEAEYPQILNWLIQGCLSWQQQKLSAPVKVTDATNKYIDGEDVIAEWLEERTEQRGSVDRPRAYKNYKAWAEGRGERAWSSKAFAAALEERGYITEKSNGARYIRGLSMHVPDAPHDGPGIDF